MITSSDRLRAQTEVLETIRADLCVAIDAGEEMRLALEQLAASRAFDVTEALQNVAQCSRDFGVGLRDLLDHVREAQRLVSQ